MIRIKLIANVVIRIFNSFFFFSIDVINLHDQ